MIRDIVILVELFAYLYCLAQLFGHKLKVSIHLVVFVILDMFLMVGINRYGFPPYLSSLTYIGMFLYGLLYYEESVKITLVNCFLAAGILAVLQLFMFLPLYYLFFTRFRQGDVNELLINVGCFILIALCSYKINFKKLSNFITKRNKIIVGVSLCVLCGLGVNFYQMVNEGKIASSAYIQIVYFSLIFIFTIFEWQKSRMDVEKKKMQLEMNQLYYDAYNQLITLVRERQHDMKSHINAIMGMIYTTDNYDDLVEKQKEYCGYVIEQNEKTKLVLATGNPLISGFLYSKMQETEKYGIELEYHIEKKKTEIPIPEYELIEIMGILFDNAIEALSKADEAIDNISSGHENAAKKICFSLKEAEKCIELIVSNTSHCFGEDITEHFFEAGYSSKGKGRGIGLSKLKRMVHERKGEIVVSNEPYEGINYLVFTIKIPTC